jgi:hypothetical protein
MGEMGLAVGDSATCEGKWDIVDCAVEVVAGNASA